MKKSRGGKTSPASVAITASLAALVGAPFLVACINLDASDVAAPLAVDEFIQPMPDGWVSEFPPSPPVTPFPSSADPAAEPEEYSIFFRAPPRDIDMVLCLYRTNDATQDRYNPQQVEEGYRSFCTTEDPSGQDPGSKLTVIELEPNSRLVDENKWVALRLACRDPGCTMTDLEKATKQWNAQ